MGYPAIFFGRSSASAAAALVLVCFCCWTSFWIDPCLGSRPVRRFKWTVGYVFWSPDCIENVVMGINGQFPGPTIRAKVGDTIAVELTNNLYTEGVVIHWHGIRQFKTPWADGTASVSQCAINPGETFVYKFNVDKEGTYFYHGHHGMQRSGGLYGSLIVDVAGGQKEPFEYDEELNLLLSDWWHKSTRDQEIGLSSIPFRWVGEPQSLLINGRGQYNCSLAANVGKLNTKQCKFKGDEQCAPEILHVLPNKTYRVRVASVTALSALNLQIGKHKMKVVEADGNYVEPFTVDDLDISSGESYSVLLTTDQEPNNYWISASVRARKPNTTQALTILNYKPTPASALPSSPPPVAPLWNDNSHTLSFLRSIRAFPGSPAPPKHCDRRLILLNTQNKINNFTRWAVNNITLNLPSTPYLGSMKMGLRNAFNWEEPPPDALPPKYNVMRPPPNPNAEYGNGVYTLHFNTTVDVVLQNANALKPNVSEIHPWHLHGHDFWVLGYGDGAFVAERDERKFNLKDPPLRNTAVLFPYGWTALRFQADNPGVWAFHCHIEPHLHLGMGVVFAEGVRRVLRIPDEALGCGLTAKKMMEKGGNN